MIHIIKMGCIPPDAKKYQTTCGYCFTVFEFDKADIQYVENGSDVHYYGYVKCPVCASNCSDITTLRD